MTGSNWVAFLGTQLMPSAYLDADLLGFSVTFLAEFDSGSLRISIPCLKAECIYGHLIKAREKELG